MEFVEGIKYLLGANITFVSEHFLEELETLSEKTRHAAAQCRAFSMLRNALFATPMSETSLAVRFQSIADWQTVVDTYLGYLSIDLEEPEGLPISEATDTKYIVKHELGNVRTRLDKLIEASRVVSWVNEDSSEIPADTQEAVKQLAKNLDDTRNQISQRDLSEGSKSREISIRDSALKEIDGELFIEDESAFHNDLACLSIYLCEQFLKDEFFLGSNKVMNLIEINFFASAPDMALYKYYHSHAKKESFVCQVYVPRHAKFFKFMRNWRQKFFSNDRVFINFLNMGVSEYKAAVITFLEFDKLRGLIAEDGTPLVAPSPAKEPAPAKSKKTTKKKITEDKTAEEKPAESVIGDKPVEEEADRKEVAEEVTCGENASESQVQDAIAETAIGIEGTQLEETKEPKTEEQPAEDQKTKDTEQQQAEDQKKESSAEPSSKNFIPKSKQKKLERQRKKEEQRKASREAALRKAREEQEARDEFVREQTRKESEWLIEQARIAEAKAKEQMEALLREKEECAARIAAYENELAGLRQRSDADSVTSMETPEEIVARDTESVGDMPMPTEVCKDEQKVEDLTETAEPEELEVSTSAPESWESYDDGEPTEFYGQTITEPIVKPKPVYTSKGTSRRTPTAFELALRAAQEVQASKSETSSRVSSADAGSASTVPSGSVARASTVASWKYSSCQVSDSVPDAWTRIDTTMGANQFSSGCVLIDGDNVNPVFMYTFLRNCFRTPTITKIHIIFDSEPLFRWDVWSGNRVTYEVAPHVNVHKNAGDIMLAYRLSKLDLEGIYDKFILVSSDSDYSCLCEELRGKLIIVSEQDKFSTKYAAYLQERNIPFLYMSDFITSEEVRKLLGDENSSPDYNFITNMLMAGRVFAR